MKFDINTILPEDNLEQQPISQLKGILVDLRAYYNEQSSTEAQIMRIQLKTWIAVMDGSNFEDKDRLRIVKFLKILKKEGGYFYPSKRLEVYPD